MKIVFTGAGGGHFYPIIAVAEKVKEEVQNQKIIDAEMYFMSDKNYDEKELSDHNIKFIKIPAGKITTYFSLQNIFTPFKTLAGFILAFIRLFIIYPDVVFAKGGYSSFPVMLAARILFIPVFIHESDSVPGRTTKWAGGFAKRIAISYSSAIKFFPLARTAFTGQPIMNKYLPSKDDLGNKLENQKNNKQKTLLILGGSQGAEKVNDIILESLSELVKNYNIIHQVGSNNYNKISIATEVILKDNSNKDNYKFFAFDDLSKYYKTSDICITRAGSTLFELSAWGIPSIIIPITNSNGDHQRINAYSYEQAGNSIVIEESNLKSNILISNIDSILNKEDKFLNMQINNLKSFKQGAADAIAKEIVKIGLSHNY